MSRADRLRQAADSLEADADRWMGHRQHERDLQTAALLRAVGDEVGKSDGSLTAVQVVALMLAGTVLGEE